MGVYFGLRNLVNNKQRKGRKLLFILLQTGKIRLMKECPGVPTKSIYAERSRQLVLYDKRVYSLNHVKDVLLRISVGAPVIMVRDTTRPYRWSVLARLSNKMEHVLVPDEHLADSYIAYVCCSGFGRKEIWGHNVFHDVPYALIDKVCTIVFFVRLPVAQ